MKQAFCQIWMRVFRAFDLALQRPIVEFSFPKSSRWTGWTDPIGTDWKSHGAKLHIIRATPHQSFSVAYCFWSYHHIWTAKPPLWNAEMLLIWYETVLIKETSSTSSSHKRLAAGSEASMMMYVYVINNSKQASTNPTKRTDQTRSNKSFAAWCWLLVEFTLFFLFSLPAGCFLLQPPQLPSFQETTSTLKLAAPSHALCPATPILQTTRSVFLLGFQHTPGLPWEEI